MLHHEHGASTGAPQPEKKVIKHVVGRQMQCCGAEAVQSRYFLDLYTGSGSVSTLDKTDKVLNDTGILFVSSQIDKRLFKKQIL